MKPKTEREIFIDEHLDKILDAQSKIAKLHGFDTYEEYKQANIPPAPPEVIQHAKEFVRLMMNIYGTK